MRYGAGFPLAMLVVGLATAADPTACSEPARHPEIPGMQVVADLGRACPRAAPIRTDCDGDGIEDLLLAGHQVGPPKVYRPPETAGFALALGGSGGLALGAALGVASSRDMRRNENFSRARALRGTGPEILWDIDAGMLISHAVLVEDRKLLITASDADHVQAVELTTGAVRWDRAFASGIVDISAGAGEVLVATRKSGFHALRLEDGAPVWYKDLPTSPLTSGGHALLAREGLAYVASKNDRVQGLIRGTGEPRWVFKTKSDPTLWLLTESSVVILDGPTLIAIDLQTGAEKWRLRLESVAGVTALAGANRPLLVHEFWDDGGKAVLNRFRAVHATTGKSLWSVDLGHPAEDELRVIHLPEDFATRLENLVVDTDANGASVTAFVADRDAIRAVRLVDGRTIWTEPSGETQLLRSAGDMLIALDDVNTLWGVAKSNGRSRWRCKVDAPVVQVEPAGEVVLATLLSGDLLIVSRSTGAVLGRHALGSLARVGADDGGGVVVCGDAGSWVYAPLAQASEIAPE